jgi:hypothetical protein
MRGRVGLSFTIATGPHQRSHTFRSQNQYYMLSPVTILHVGKSPCQESHSLWTLAIYNSTRNFSTYIYMYIYIYIYICIRLGIAERAITDTAHITTGAYA